MELAFRLIRELQTDAVPVSAGVARPLAISLPFSGDRLPRAESYCSPSTSTPFVSALTDRISSPPSGRTAVDRSRK